MKIEIDPGTHILAACKEAIEAAKKHGEPVMFDFNGIGMTAHHDGDALGMMHDWNIKAQQKAEEYRRSPAGIKAAQEAAQRARDNQAKVDELLGTLRQAVNRVDTLVDWLAEFCVPADHVNVTYDKSVIIESIRHAGYVKNYGVGDPPESFGTRDRMGRYIIGQALTNMMEHDLPPHPITTTFAERFRRLPA